MSKLLTFKSKRNHKVTVILAFTVLFAGLFLFGAIPTQWFASRYAYDVNLGTPLTMVGSIAVYWPTEWLAWGWRFGDEDALRSNVHFMAMLGAATVALSIVAAIATSMHLSDYSNGMEGLHGTAHWAERDEVNNTGFLSVGDYESRGVVVGSVIMDRKRRVIHPHHPKYARRYKPLMVRRPGWKGALGMRVQKRDKHGQPMYTVRRSVVKYIEILRDGKNTHIFAFCPTRSGKGRGMIIPTLLTWPKSVMVNDPKGEAYALTAGFRAYCGQEAIKFEPACKDGSGARWNPLDEIRIFTADDVKDAQMIMSMACDPKGEGLEDYFDKAGYEFLTGLALHVCYAEDNNSLEGIAQFLGDPRWDTDKQMYQHMLTVIHDPDGKMGWRDSGGALTNTHPMIANAAKTMLNKEDKDRSGVLSTAKSLLSLYLDPIVAQNTRCSDFKVRDLMTHHKPVSLYYVVGPADMVRLIPLTRLFYDLFIRRNAADMEFADGRSKESYSFELLMIIDEMTSLKKLPVIQEALGYVAGYGIRIFMLVQDIAQVEDLYGDKQTVESGSETRVVYAPNRTETAQKISSMAGKTTVTEAKATQSVDGMKLVPGNTSLNTEKIQRDLITAEEVSSLHDQDVLIFVKGQPPIYGRKAFYDEDPVLLGRAKMPAPKRSAVLRTPEKRPHITSASETRQAVPDEPPTREQIVEDMSEKWEASRRAMAEQISRKLGASGDNSSARHDRSSVDGKGIVAAKQPVGGEGEGGSSDRLDGPSDNRPRPKPRSRYANRDLVLTAADRERINSLVADVALTEQVAKISAF